MLQVWHSGDRSLYFVYRRVACPGKKLRPHLIKTQKCFSLCEPQLFKDRQVRKLGIL